MPPAKDSGGLALSAKEQADSAPDGCNQGRGRRRRGEEIAWQGCGEGSYDVRRKLEMAFQRREAFREILARCDAEKPKTASALSSRAIVSKIAKKHYGDESGGKAIFDAKFSR